MEIFTQADFDAFPVVFETRHCPSGDYRRIRNFGRLNSFAGGSLFGRHSTFESTNTFGEGCSFGATTYFGHNCRFEKGCLFSSSCMFGSNCDFGKACVFESTCSFGSHAEFGIECIFGNGCDFGLDSNFRSRSVFGRYCTFGPTAYFKNDCSFEGHKARTSNPYLAIDRAGTVNRKTYFFDFEDGIYVRSGCFFGTLQAFRSKVKHDEAFYPSEKKTAVYLGFADLAEIQFKD